ncbi:MAG: EAL domain-containing protein [Gallionella sp.]|nr:EAL domain-containing protein [Gallionella sp.]
MFRLLRYFSIASLVSMVLAAVVLGMLHQSLEKDHLLRYGESRNVALARSFSNSTWPKFQGLLNSAKGLDANTLRRQPVIARLGRSVRNAVRNTATLRVQIYQLDGRMLFSTDAAQIGTSNGSDPGFLSATRGVPQSGIIHYDKYDSLNGKLADREVLTSFIPLRPGASQPVQAVMAIDTDITDLVASDTREGTRVALSVIAVLTALYAILFFIVKYADNIIRSQYEKQRLIEQNLRHVITHDALTNLPNRLLLLDRIKQSLTSAERNNSLLAVAFVDLDFFQNINNSLGHEIGNDVLQIVTHRLGGCIRESDTIARLGGDEFVVSVPDIKSRADILHISTKMLNAVALPIEVGGHELHLTASIGIALYPEHGKDAETLIGKADMAMHNAKRLGRNRHQLFVEHMSEEIRQQARLENEMWLALENNQFVLHYQPVIDLKSGQIIGAEALVRWPNEQGTWLSPAEFIPKSEKCGLIAPLSEWILSEACAQLQAWRESGKALGQLSMAVNMSSIHFATPGLETMIAGVIEQSEIDPKLLHLEITDGFLKNPDESVLDNFEGLKRVGIKFTLDDFGSGYSSLGNLRSFPIDLLKIDRTFIRSLPDNADNAAIVTTIISLANSLDLTVVAKGVETAAQLSFLQQHGCHHAQGFLFSHPLPADEFLSLALERRDMRVVRPSAPG